MRNITSTFAAIFAVWLLAGCEPDDGTGGEDAGRLIVVEGFVYADEPVRRINLSKFHEAGRSQTAPVSDAQVTVEQGGTSFPLQVSDSSPGLYTQADTAAVPDGNGPVSIKINYGGMQYTASSPMPAEITGLQITESEIHLQGNAGDEVLTELSWNPHPGGKYCVFIREIQSNIPLGGPTNDNAAESPFGRVLQSNSLELKASHFQSSGSFALYVTAVSEDYVRLYGAGAGMNLTGASGNISGGVGVFTAFNGETVILDIH